MVKVYYIEKKSEHDKIKKINEDIKAKVKIIVFVYWDACGHCKEITPNWQEACNTFKRKNPESNVDLAYINKDTLPLLDIDREMNAFPYFATIKGDKIEEFNPDRSVSGLVKFLETESANNMIQKGGKIGSKTTRRKREKMNKTKKRRAGKFYNISKMLFSKKMKVSDIHTVYYSGYGNPKGKPVLVVHGGPGGGTSPKMTKFYDPKKYYIILVDQRGCGKSTPLGETRENDTHKLIYDFEKIRKELGIKKWILSGGSWGSFLSLVYAIKHPEVVKRLILRGIYLGGKDEIDWVFNGTGANHFYPEDWKEFVEIIPKSERVDLVKAYGKRIEGKLGKKEQEKALMAYSKWETKISNLKQLSNKEINNELKKNDAYKTISILENHYFKNNNFTTVDYLKKKTNYTNIRKIPIDIVHGRYDLVCPPSAAYLLKDLVPHAKLHFTHAGHSTTDKGNAEKLLELWNKYKN
jgi:proline iminopeptidase